MKTRCIIVDDEELALDVLENFISQVDFLQLEGRCKTAVEALAVLNKKKIDLMFLDIQMPGLTGMQFLKSLSHPPEVIITTAYPNYAVEGFEMQVLDYLLKPIPFDRFLKAVNRFTTRNATAGGIEMPVSKQVSMFVKSEKQMMNIIMEDIVYIESIRNYVVIRLKDKREIRTLSTITAIEEKLPATEFMRIHRSFIVAVNKIQSYNGGGVMAGDKFLPFGRSYKDHALHTLQKKGV
jgi:DNA-binding LytR/AlgR family response regulator